jgi:hypothetical protein
MARRALLIVAGIAAAFAIFAGLARLGITTHGDAAAHGPLFVLGVFVTVISLERTVAYGRAWAYAAPVLSALSMPAFLAHFSGAAWIALAAAVALLAINVALLGRQADAPAWLMLLGAASLCGANLWLALGAAVPTIVRGWITFFVLTIAAERLELSRLAPVPAWARRAFIAVALALPGLAFVPRAFGVALAAIGVWQWIFDIARRTIRRGGLPRFAATGVLAAAGWLLVSGVLFASVDIPPAGPLYDAALHAVFVGYVLSMVFAHAPIILPAVARIPIHFSSLLYVPLAVLHAALLLRIAGDLTWTASLRSLGALLTAIAIPLFPLAVLSRRSR